MASPSEQETTLLAREARWFAVIATAVLIILLCLVFTNLDNPLIDMVTIFWGLVIWVLAIMLAIPSSEHQLIAHDTNFG